jgi:hypothetical protein
MEIGRISYSHNVERMITKIGTKSNFVIIWAQILNGSLQSKETKEYYTIDKSEFVGFRLWNGNITFYFKNIPTLNLVINEELLDTTMSVLKIIFPMDDIDQLII